MKTKIVYVLSSSEDDYYLEQTLVSVLSVKYYNPDAWIELVLDRDTEASLCGNRSEITNHFSKLIAVDTPCGYNGLLKSRYIKTRLRSLVDGDYLYIDGDTIIARSLAAIDDIEGDICAVADRHIVVEKHPSRNYIHQQLSKCGVSIDEYGYYINSGVMLVRDSSISYDLYNMWTTKWESNIKLGVFTDQPALAYADAKCGHPIKIIDGQWNCQITGNGIRFLFDAYIIHYFASNNRKEANEPYLLMNHSIYSDLKHGRIPDSIEAIIKEPLLAFSEVCTIIGEDDTCFLNSYLNNLFYANRKLFNILDKLCLWAYKFLVATKLYHHRKR